MPAFCESLTEEVQRLLHFPFVLDRAEDEAADCGVELHATAQRLLEGVSIEHLDARAPRTGLRPAGPVRVERGHLSAQVLDLDRKATISAPKVEDGRATLLREEGHELSVNELMGVLHLDGPQEVFESRQFWKVLLH